MARLAIGIVCAVIGYVASGFNPAGAAAGFAIGYGAAGYIFPTQLPTVIGPRLEDLNVPDATYGGVVPMVWGQVRLAGNVIWASTIMETRHEETEEGGKGGSTEQTKVTYTYSVHVAVGLCLGPISKVRRVWANGELIYENGSYSSDIASHIRFYLGGETQEADALMEAYLGTGNVPAYRGVAYAVLENLQLERFGNRVPVFSFEVQAGGDSGYTGAMQGIDISNDPVNYPDTYGQPYAGNGGYGTIYNPDADEVWCLGDNNNVTWDSAINRFDARTGAYKGYACLPQGSSHQLCGDVVCHDSVAHWMLYPTSDPPYGLAKFDAYTGEYLGVLVTGYYNWCFAVGRVEGSIWVVNYKVTLDTVAKVNKASGGFIAEVTLDHVYENMTVDREGNLWIINSKYELGSWVDYLTEVSVSGVQHEYPTPNNNSFYPNFMIYNPERHSLIMGDIAGYYHEFSLTSRTYVAATYLNNIVPSLNYAVDTGINPTTISNWMNYGGGNAYLDPVNGEQGVIWVLSDGKVWDATYQQNWYDRVFFLVGIDCATLGFYGYGVTDDFMNSDDSDTMVICGIGATPYGPFGVDDHEVYVPMLGRELWLSEVVSDICKMVNVNEDQLDVSSLTEPVTGFAIANAMTARAAIEHLQQAYFFDVVETTDGLDT